MYYMEILQHIIIIYAQKNSSENEVMKKFYNELRRDIETIVSSLHV